jgi:hypothetical protein
LRSRGLRRPLAAGAAPAYVAQRASRWLSDGYAGEYLGSRTTPGRERMCFVAERAIHEGRLDACALLDPRCSPNPSGITRGTKSQNWRTEKARGQALLGISSKYSLPGSTGMIGSSESSLT